MKTFGLILGLLASGCLAARVETITLDLERPQQPFTVTLTEATDSTVSAELRASGSEFNPAGWTGLLWYGTAGGGLTLTNVTSGYGLMTWSVPVASMPTNGRYSVQILGAISNRVEEWGRGALNVRVNPSRDYLPEQWATNNPAYAAAMQAQAALTAHAAATNPHGITPAGIGAATPAEVTEAVGAHSGRTDNPHGVTPAQIGAATSIQIVDALASNRVTQVFSATNSNEWTDGDGNRWRITYDVVTNISCTLSSPFGKMTGPDMYDRPNEPFYISAPNTQVDADNSWLVNFDANNEGLWNVFNYNWGLYWYAAGYTLPLVAVGGMGECIGTATFDYAFTYTPVTSLVSVAATESFVASALSNAPPQTLTSTDGILRWDSGFSKWFRIVLTNGYELYFEANP